jgi:hypothetical protein
MLQEKLADVAVLANVSHECAGPADYAGMTLATAPALAAA